VLSLPLSVRAQIGPNPRIIDEAAWAKLMAAGLTLTAEDLEEYATPAARITGGDRRTFYPVEMVRALVATWLFTGLRIDEIRRLEPDRITLDQGHDQTTGQPYPICLLHVPHNKTSGPFNKPVDPIVGQLIGAWQQVRLPQPRLADRKTGQHRQFLFCYRGQLVGGSYLNDHLIPALCHKAGIPESDSRGALTSHRARATIATQLLNAPEPLSLPDLQQWLGHKHPASTRHYAAILQHKPTAAYHKADHFARNLRTIQVLIDRDTILPGAAAGGGQPWTYYDLGEAGAPTTSSPSAPTGWPAPAAPSTCPSSPTPGSCWRSRTASTRCWSSWNSPTTNAPRWKATATPSPRSPNASPTCPPPPAPPPTSSAPSPPSSP